MSDVRRTVSAAPPPRRSIEVPEPTEEGSHKLNLDGFSLPVTAPAVGDRGPRAVPEGRRVSATGMTKTTIQLPNRLVGRLRAWKAETGRSNADAVLTAYINQLEAVRTRHAPTDEDKRRAEFGLPPLASHVTSGGHGRGTSGPGRPVCAGRSRGRSRCHRHRTRTVTLTASHRAPPRRTGLT